MGCDSAHYALLAGWWRETHGTDFVPADCLPPTLVTAARDGGPQAAVALYLMNAAIAQLAFAVVDPALSQREAVTALDAAIAAAMQLARSHLRGRGFVACVTHDPMLHRMVQKHHGFTAVPDPFAAHLILDPAMHPDNLSS